jgi:hypothetical protein
MSVQFQDTQKSLSQTLNDVAESVTGESITLRQLLMLVGEQGLLLFCMILIIPFLLPVSIPGVSTVFGLLIVLIGIGVTLNRLPWLPNRLMERSIKTADLRPAFEKGANLFARLDRIIRPRMLALTNNAVTNRINGLALTFSGVLLMAPLSLIPFSNTIPGIAVLFFAVGLLQRDGVFILLGYAAMIGTVIYFGALALAAIAMGQGISSLIGIVPSFMSVL